jgi:hypothetical protein
LRSKSRVEDNKRRVRKEEILIEIPTLDLVEELKIDLPKDEKQKIFNLSPIRQLNQVSSLSLTVSPLHNLNRMANRLQL